MMIRILAPIAIVAMAATPAAAQTMSAATYVAKAGAGDQYEIQSSRLVLATTTNPMVRDFANQMIADHTKSTADVKAAAQQASVRVPAPKLEPMQMRNIAALRATRGAARDALYNQQQKAAH
jgi:putative membrane protein